MVQPKGLELKGIVQWIDDLIAIQNDNSNFKRPKNGEDGSDFDDFWTKRIAALSAKF